MDLNRQRALNARARELIDEPDGTFRARAHSGTSGEVRRERRIAGIGTEPHVRPLADESIQTSLDR